ncbi:MAG: gliding motility-associated C-terminal domain-containing protein [Saprospiraceae bacterium]|nr:gliding motility-associated C-terminal domain-containing protein [Saprospiraceae bacterium]
MNVRVLVCIMAALFTFGSAIHAQDQDMNISISCNDGVNGQTRCVTFTSETALSQLNSLQFVISYNPSVLNFIQPPGVNPTCLTGLSTSEFNDNNNGNISFIWTQTPAIDLLPGCTLFTLCFNLIGNPGDSSAVTISLLNDIEANSEFGKVDLNFNDCVLHILPDDLTIIRKYCNPSSAGAMDASITFYGIGGVPNYNYTVREGVTTIATGVSGDKEEVTLSNLKGGNYTITIQDATGKIRTIPVNIPDVGQPSFAYDVYDPSCFSLANGKIRLKSINVLNTPYLIQWSNGIFNQDSIEGLRNGNYTVSIIDANGCKATENINIFADTLTMQVEILDSASCKGLKDGLIRITGLGGTPYPGNNYQVALINNTFIAVNNPHTWASAPAGIVRLQLQDNAKNYLGNMAPCKIEKYVFIPYKYQTNFTVNLLEDVKCFGEATGRIEVKAGGVGVGTNFSLNVYDQATGQPHPGGINGPMGVHLNNTLEAGSYCLFSRSNLGCLDTFCFDIKQPATKLVVSAVKTDPSCIGQGSITINVSGGVPGYTYKWQDDVTPLPSRANLPEGNYIVTVTDAALCDTILNIELKNSIGTANIDAVVANAISCKDASDGEVTVNLSSNPTNVLYAWTNKANTQNWSTKSVSGLPTGTYFVTVTIDGCVATDTVFLANPLGLVISGLEIKAPECPNGGFKGSLGITLSGGFPQYTYEWRLQGNAAIIGNNSVLASIDPGTYTISMRDQKQCAKDTTLVLPGALDFTLNVSSIIAISCNGEKDGKATALAGLGPVNNGTYRFFWSSGESSGGIFNPHSAFNLQAGRNWVYVTDSKCVSDTVFFDVADKNAITAIATPSGICAGACTGQIDVVVAGGTGGALSINWPSIPSAGGSVFNLCAGSYPFVVTDGNGCSFSDTIIIQAVDTLTVSIDSSLTVPLSCKTSIGQLALNVSGGSPAPGTGYVFNWFPNVSTSALATDLGQGVYAITVTDQNGCSDTISYQMNRPNAISAIIPPPASPACFGGTSCIAVTSVTGGTGYNYSMQINNGLRIPVDSCIQLFAGTYLVSIFDASGCKTDTSVTIIQPDQILVDLGEDLNLNLGEETGIISPLINATLPIVNYFWTGLGDLICLNDPCNEIQGTPKTDLFITLQVTDENGCTGRDELNIAVKDERRVFLPNIFKTSGQDANRRFDITTGFGVSLVESFYIYDRWGSVVYSNFNYIPDETTGWDGLINGSQALPGVYVFTATVRFLDGVVKTYTGDVSLIK